MNTRAQTVLLAACIAALGLALALSPSAHAVETDQYMTWGFELEDSAEPINAFVNAEIEVLLEKKNRRDEDCVCEDVAYDILRHFFRRRPISVIRQFMRELDETDFYPPLSMSSLGYMKKSIYKVPSFPYFVPLARTWRVGDVYFGGDKIGHMFGFGSRYYRRYQRYVRKGLSEEEAMEKVVHWGFRVEDTLVGRFTDGVFSHGDMEANFQGMMMGRAMCEGKDRHILETDQGWILARPVDMREFITPDFDESYNPNHYWGLRKKRVLRVLEQYAEQRWSPIVQKRFERYREHEPSFSKRYLDRLFNNRKNPNPQHEQTLAALSALPWDTQAGSEAGR